MHGKTMIILSLLLAYSNINILGIADLQTIFLFLFFFLVRAWGGGRGGVFLQYFCFLPHYLCRLQTR